MNTKLRRSPGWWVVIGLAAGVLIAGCSGPGPLTSASVAGSPSASSASAGPTTSAANSATAEPWPEPASGALPEAKAALLQEALDRWIASDRLKGATAAVVTADGSWTGAAGVDGAGKKLRPDAAMWLASVTKTFTAAEVLHLVSVGRLELDAPVSSYVEVPFDTQGATVRQLLGMRSGFADFPRPRFLALMAADLDRNWTPTEMLARYPEATTPLGSPGGVTHYNSTNYVILGQVIAKVTQRSFAEALRADLLEPAGLTRVWVQGTEQPTAPLSRGTNPTGAELVAKAGPFLPSRAVATFTGAGACLAGDASDLARWGYLLYGGRVVGTDVPAQMWADPQTDDTGIPYGLGTQVFSDDTGATFVGHAGGGTEFPYSTNLSVWVGDAPVSIAVLSPQPADFAQSFWSLIMLLHQVAAAGS